MSNQSSEDKLPPKGDEEKAEKYLSQLIQLVNDDKLEVLHTDLSKFDPSDLQDHYRVDLKEYQVEISHSKQPNTGADSYVMLFTNVQNIKDGCDQKLILAYIHLSSDQFQKFQMVSNDQINRKIKAEEEKRFKEAMAPIDQILGDIVTQPEHNQEPYVAPAPSNNHQEDPVLKNIFDSSLPPLVSKSNPFSN